MFCATQHDTTMSEHVASNMKWNFRDRKCTSHNGQMKGLLFHHFLSRQVWSSRKVRKKPVLF